MDFSQIRRLLLFYFSDLSYMSEKVQQSQQKPLLGCFLLVVVVAVVRVMLSSYVCKHLLPQFDICRYDNCFLFRR